MNRKLFSRVVAIVLAVIMIGSVFLVAFQAFAISPMGSAEMMIANTGDQSSRNIIIIAAVVAVVVLVALVVVPAILKKKK